MKKIDLHIHTIPTVNDSSFSFKLAILQKYVAETALDAIAITNHNVFDRSQFTEIDDELDIVVFPGIEVTLDCGHILIISDTTKLDQFDKQALRIRERITQAHDTITINELTSIFYNLKEYVVIPHYDKKPAIRDDSLKHIAEYVSAGEVDSAKKFIRVIKDDIKVTPVLFSDIRIGDTLDKISTRQTFVDCGEVTLAALKKCLQDKRKVALSESNGNRLYQIFDDGQKLSTGLNILLGERSSGKTYTLDKINASQGHVKYIKQFSLVQQDESANERQFNRDLQRTKSQFVEEYLSRFKVVLNDVMDIDLCADGQEVDSYIDNLHEAAEDAERRDAFSNCALFDESEFSISEDTVLIDLIASIRQIIQNVEYQSIINKYVDRQSLKQLAVELIELLWARERDWKKKILVNELVRDIRQILKRRTSTVQVPDVNLYRVSLNKKKVEIFCEIVKCLQEHAVISEEPIQKFRVIATKDPFEGAGEIRSISGVKTAFSESFAKYTHPYEYLQALLANEYLTRSEIYKYFVKITYSILNPDGFEVSGGERSEFRLLQEIKDAQTYDILLVDEPESSFDNLFLRSDVNKIIKEISETMPVVVVTHNSTVGASVGADYLLYARKELEQGKVVYRLYSGYPTDLTLHSLDGKKISNYQITMNSLEAGCVAYDDRRNGYEAIRDKG